MLHGGLANSSYWGNQIPELAKSYQVIVMDSRGHGRSSQNGKPFTYDRMVSDVVALMKHLQLPKSAIIGWSDGAIIALKLAIDHPERVSGVFAFAANSNPSGTHDLTNNEMFEKYKKRTRGEFTKLSPTEFTYDDFYGQMMAMWTSQPDLTESDLHRIRVPVWIADGDHDEIIKRTDTLFIADNIPNSGLLIQPEVSHFSLLQDPHQFTKDVLCFLQAKGIGKSTSVSSGCRSG
jgi:pimeloyl-ACP methyl ester carboxylesterase